MRKGLHTDHAGPVLGVCWFPEQWPQQRWERDVELMVEAGLEAVRIGEFAWSWYEPAAGALDLSGLDRAVDLLGEAGLQVVLCTPTATPPRWLTTAEPTVLAVTSDARRRAPGSRRHTCPTSPAYRAHSRRITTALAERFADRVAAWQLDNEPGNHDSARCWCDTCEDAFRDWVADRYGDADALDAAWGTAFWSMQYHDVEAVEFPRPTVTAQNPALELAHRRFASHQVVGFLADQREALLAVDPDAVTVTNEYADDHVVKQVDVARLHGVAGIDSYPHGTRGPLHTAFLLDHARGRAVPAGVDAATHGGRAWILEQQPGRINWTSHNAAVAPGQVLTWSWQAALHGIEALLFFRWRAAAGGQEQYHAGLLTHDGEPAIGWHDAKAFAAVRAELAPDALQRPAATAAVVVDDDARWALDIEQHVVGAGHDDLVLPAHEALRRCGHDVDVVPTDVDLRGYDVVAAPALHLASDELVAPLLAALDAGVTVLVGPRALVRTIDSGWVTRPAPDGLVERLGARVVDAGAVGTWPTNASATTLRTSDGRSIETEAWAETLAVDADDVAVVATHTDAWREGEPAIVRRDGLVLVGAAGTEPWLHVVEQVTGRSPGPATEERFERAAGTFVIDHESLSISLSTR